MANYEFSQISGDRPCCRLSRNVQICLGVGLLVLIALVVILVIVLWPRSLLVWNGSPTTKHFPEIFLGRCLVYTQILRPEMRDQDCKKLLGAFKRAFVSKNPCNITTEDYEPLVKMATQTIPCNKSLFWSKSKDLAHKYTWVQGKLFTLEDTLLGYIADDLRWCGDPSTSDMNYESCPHWRDNCPNNPITVYWKVISKKFAEDACGVVQVMLNGSLSEPFHKNSTFGSVEVFNLDPDKVHKLEAWVMHDIETAFRYRDTLEESHNLQVSLRRSPRSQECTGNRLAQQTNRLCSALSPPYSLHKEQRLPHTSALADPRSLRGGFLLPHYSVLFPGAVVQRK